jgi:hypothetical protein
VTAAAEEEEDMVETVEAVEAAATAEMAAVEVESEMVARATECWRVYGVAGSFADWFEVRLAR